MIAGATSASGSGIDRAKLDRSLATAFAHLYRMQTAELHRPAVTEAELRTSASCDKGSPYVPDSGPGNDWRCVVTWRLPGTAAVGSAIYQLDVNPDGRYVADGDGPQEVNGFFQVHTLDGRCTEPPVAVQRLHRSPHPFAPVAPPPLPAEWEAGAERSSDSREGEPGRGLGRPRDTARGEIECSGLRAARSWPSPAAGR